MRIKSELSERRMNPLSPVKLFSYTKCGKIRPKSFSGAFYLANTVSNREQESRGTLSKIH